MKKLSMLIALALCITIGGVYATWIYTNSDDVADVIETKALTMTNVSYDGSYGTYDVDSTDLTMKVDPLNGTTHTTGLLMTGTLTITFTPNQYAPAEILESGVASTFALKLPNANWKYNDQQIVTVDTTAQDITWVKEANGTFTCTVSAGTLEPLITLTPIVLDTKAEYDAYGTVLGTGSIELVVSDGKTVA